ncbi:MAG: acetyl-CoA C-acetyltransferase [Panacagrimonas sp.]|jgi:acetyl-CoA C-acetyltransferase|nr:acetyl-CoA C-acetyltransferase [Panacagrimonas sp.]MCC2657346.1 acetyl-CoA C-acetyltransferase [Panacagrimonas sp.]
MKQTVKRVAILGGARIPFARSNGAYAEASNKDMLTASLRGVVDKFQLHGERLGEVAAGAVLKHSRDFNLCRESVLSAGLSPDTPAYDVQMACGTGLQAAVNIGNKIALGQIEVGISGGVDTTSDAPIGVNEKLRKILLEANRGRTNGQKLKALSKFRPSMLAPAIPAVTEPRTRMSMGQHCEVMAKTWNIAREEQDQLAFESHMKAAAAYESGFYSDLVVPFRGLERDNNMRADTSLEKLASLKPAYDRTSGTLTAGNSTPLTDGASTVLLASEDWAASRGLEPQAYLTHAETAAVDFASGKEGLLMAPAYAVPRMLARAGIKLQDFDFYEIHEAFAAQVLCTLKAWNDPKFCKERLGLNAPLGTIDRSRMNIRGGSVALGHPFAATGGRILATLAKIIEENKGGRGLISICAAGGLGITAIVER